MSTPAPEEPRRTLEHVLPGEAATVRAAHAALREERRGLRALWPFLGPAFIASVAYVDPGNFATALAAGSKFGYLLLWVVLAANLMAMLVQTLSAKLGIASRLRSSQPFQTAQLLQLGVGRSPQPVGGKAVPRSEVTLMEPDAPLARLSSSHLYRWTHKQGRLPCSAWHTIVGARSSSQRSP